MKGLFRWLFSPSAKLSVFVLLLIGLLVGAASVIGTQVMVHYTGTTEFCGNACHSMQAFTLPEYKESVHYSNPSGVQAGCADCHIPHSYPGVLFYKAKAGMRDAYHEIRGTISTQEKYDKERWRMANHVWDEMRANNSANCRTCHSDKAMASSKQSASAQKNHRKLLTGEATCIDCHKGVAHKEPEEPEEPAEPAKTSMAN
jgi:nitrate/TMAO reductase-like tetraheme cytochrome c subunit